MTMQTRYSYHFVLAILGIVLIGMTEISIAQTADGQARFISGPATGSAKPWTGQPFARGDAYLRFAVIGDRTGMHRPGVFEQTLNNLEMLHPEFVISVGDNIEGYTEDTTELKREWDEILGLTRKLSMPFFFTVGNHDMGNGVMLDTWRNLHGSTYYHFIYQDALFLVLNTEDPPQPLPKQMLDQIAYIKHLMQTDPGKLQTLLENHKMDQGDRSQLSPVAISDKQLEWAKKVLEQHRDVRWTFVLMHKPAWQYPGEKFIKIEEALGDRNYTVFAGHEHNYELTRRNGHDYIRLGTAGGVFHHRPPGNTDHLMMVTLTPNGPRIANVALDGVFSAAGPMERQGK